MNLKSAFAMAQSDWKSELREAFRDPAELGRFLELPPHVIERIDVARGAFPLLVPRGFAARMQKGKADDPLLLQVLPSAAEDTPSPEFGPDPLAEQPLATDGCIHKYPHRALLITTGACPIHCRYCFRREFPYASQNAGAGDFEPALNQIRQAPEIDEVILSGGDPLSLGNERLHRLIARLEQFPNLATLRIHTRYPIAIPSRVDTGLIEILAACRLSVVVVLHINHPAEIDESVAVAANALKRCTRTLLNQSVLLRGINDDVDTLVRLSQRLLDIAVLPYYLHLLDRVSGTAHFEVPEAKAQALIDSMRRQVPGYLVPRLVRDVAGRLSKTPIGPLAV